MLNRLLNGTFLYSLLQLCLVNYNQELHAIFCNKFKQEYKPGLGTLVFRGGYQAQEQDTDMKSQTCIIMFSGRIVFL